MIKTLKWIYNLGWQHGYDEAVADAKAKQEALIAEKEFIKSLRG